MSNRPLWVIGLMFALHLVWSCFCVLWIPMTFGKTITGHFGSPFFIAPLVIWVYALAPLVASFSELGRDYWDLLGRGGPARGAAVKVVIVGAVVLVLAIVANRVIQR